MGGGILQLSAYGSQDIFLTGNPQITFFKSVYHRHTNYSVESMEYSFDGDRDARKFGTRLTVTIPKNGDLIYRSYLQIKLNDPSNNWKPYVGHVMIENISLYIGRELIDKHSGEWLNTWGELSTPQSKWRTYQGMIGYPQTDNSSAMILYIPLQFWFCRRLGSALPICALQNQDIRIVLELRGKSDVMSASENGLINYIKLYVDNIYLDTKEKKRFLDNDHEYLIEQVQYNGEDPIVSSTSKECELIFNHPIKEIIWTTKQASNELFDYNEERTLNEVSLKINGIPRFPVRPGRYFSFVQPYQHHTRVPAGEPTEELDANVPNRDEPSTGNSYNKQIHVYSFAEKPEELQPSGTLNMSMTDKVTLKLTYDSAVTNSIIKIFAVNYNVLRIMSGMAGLAFSN